MSSPSQEPPDETLAPYRIEGARSSRSKCKSCRRTIDKGKLRIGIRIEGPFGSGYLWHHLSCAARRHWTELEEAYEGQHWDEGLDLPPLDELRKTRDKAEQKKAEKKEVPYVEVAPTGRSSCKHCGELIAKGSYRFVLAREVKFFNQVRVGPINVHPGCVADALEAEDNATDAQGLAAAVRANSHGVESTSIDEALALAGSAAT